MYASSAPPTARKWNNSVKKTKQRKETLEDLHKSQSERMKNNTEKGWLINALSLSAYILVLLALRQDIY